MNREDLLLTAEEYEQVLRGHLPFPIGYDLGNIPEWHGKFSADLLQAQLDKCKANIRQRCLEEIEKLGVFEVCDLPECELSLCKRWRKIKGG